MGAIYREAGIPAHEQIPCDAFFFANAVKCEPDKQGRIVIPQRLREYAKLSREVVILGVNDRAEIWSQERWAMSEAEMTPEKMAACMDELGF